MTNDKLGCLVLFWAIVIATGIIYLTISVYEHRLKQIEETSGTFFAELQAENYVLLHDYEDVAEVKKYVKEVIYGINP